MSGLVRTIIWESEVFSSVYDVKTGKLIPVQEAIEIGKVAA
ncbi:hypothetical protein [Leptospira tipperaryensis]|nr:hypothetical protein [Leptospira tipperaryensis]